MQSTVNVTMSWNVRDTCGIETGEHKRRNKRDHMQSERTNTRSTKEGRESNIGTCTTKVHVETVFYKKHIEGGHVTREHKGLSPTRVRSRSKVTTKESLKRKTKETYYKVQTVTR